MARTRNEIYNDITAWFVSTAVIKAVYGLEDNKTFAEQFSAVSIEAVIFSTVATAIWALEKLFDLHKQEVNEIIATMKPHTIRWYAAKFKLFQYGDDLIADSDEYDNEGKTNEQIAASRIIAYSAVAEIENRLVGKVAKDTGDLAPLDAEELSAFKEYVARIKDAGVQVEIITENADNLRQTIDIYYNPLILNARGERLDGSSLTPVVDAIRAYLKNLPFNGELVLAFLADALQKIDGVVIPHIVSSAYQYGGLDWTPFAVKVLPHSGYLRITDENLTINYIAQTDIR